MWVYTKKRTFKINDDCVLEIRQNQDDSYSLVCVGMKTLDVIAINTTIEVLEDLRLKMTKALADAKVFIV